MSNQIQEPPQLGLRERKKLKTRLAISDVATRLFIERGFENVTIAQVAEAAEVSVNTVFNYFTTKEELFFDRGVEFSAAPSRVVRERRKGESAVAALRRSFRKLIRDDGTPLIGQRLRPFLSAIEASPALQARSRLLIADAETKLWQTLVEETGSDPADPTARSVAALATGVQAMLMKTLWERILDGTPDLQLRAELSRLGERGFELLLTAAGDYCVRS